MWLYEPFHLVQNLSCKLKGIRGHGLLTLENGPQKCIFFIFHIYYAALKIVTYVLSYTGYALLVKILLKFELI